MSLIDRYISPASRRQSLKVSAQKFSTVHLRIHTDIYELLKQEATDNGISIPAALEFILATHFKPKIERLDMVKADLGTD